MATTERIARRINDRKLYLLAAILFPLIVFIGFARTYYLRALFNTPAIPSGLVHFHGLVMTAWVALFVTQVTLVATKRTRMHQRLGILGSFLAALVFIVGVLTGLFAAARGASPGPPALQFLIVPLGDMLVFAVLIAIALYNRKRFDVHKRLMLLAAVSLLAPAIARIPLSFITNGGPLAFYGLTDLCLLACVAFDTIKHRRLHPVFLWGTLFVILSQPLRLIFSETELWMRIAATLVSFMK